MVASWQFTSAFKEAVSGLLFALLCDLGFLRDVARYDNQPQCGMTEQMVIEVNLGKIRWCASRWPAGI
jgi:hypothetical protein